MRRFARALALGGLACTGPIVRDEVHDVDPKMLAKIAVGPFEVSPEFRGSSGPGAVRDITTPGDKAAASDEAAKASDRVTPSDKAKSATEKASGTQGPEAAKLVTRIASEAFAAAGFDVIPASDVANVFEARGQPVPREDRAALAAAAAREFGATAVLSGSVYRYRERSGGELGTTQPASVGIELTLNTAP